MKQTKDVNKNDWCTPRWLFDRLQEVFQFEVDGASDGKNNLLSTYHVKEDPWFYRLPLKTFINPPFNDIDLFLNFYRYRNFTCFLLPFRPETRIWHRDIWPYATIFVFNKRIQYIHPETKKEVKGAAFPSCLVFFGDLKPYDLTKLSDLGIFISKVQYNKDDK